MPVSTRVLRRATIALASVLGLATLAAGGWYAASPYYTVHSMQQAALQGDAERFTAYVDFPELRASLKTEIRARLAAEAAAAPPSSLRAIGIGLAMGFVDQMVDSAVSPETVGIALASLGSAGDWVAPPGLDSLSLLAASGLDIERQALDRFRVALAEDEDRPALLFCREGLGWKLYGVDLAGPARPLPDA